MQAQGCLKECQDDLESQKVKFKEVYETGRKSFTERTEDVKSKIEKAKDVFQQKVSSIKEKAEETVDKVKTIETKKKRTKTKTPKSN